MVGAEIMQKYTNGIIVRYFEDAVKVSDWIDLTQYRLMTDIEILKHETKRGKTHIQTLTVSKTYTLSIYAWNA